MAIVRQTTRPYSGLKKYQEKNFYAIIPHSMANHESSPERDSVASSVKAENGLISASDLASLTEVEQSYYQELFGKFFEKFARWHNIVKEYGEPPPSPRRYYFLFIYKSLDTSYFGYPLSDPFSTHSNPHDYKEQVLEVGCQGSLVRDPRWGMAHLRFAVKPGPAGKKSLVDPGNRQIKEFKIEVIDQPPAHARSIVIATEYAQYTETVRDRYKSIEYRIVDGQVDVNRYLFHPYMSDDHALHVINTLDALIPDRTSSIPQPENRTSQGPQTPKSLPRVLRRLPRT